MYNPPLIEKNEKMPTVLIAGGAGFLGSYLTESLLSQSFRVAVVDNLETGKKDQIEAFFSHPRFAFFKHNLNLGTPQKIKSVDFIFHLAAHEAYLFAKKESISLDSLLTNALATYNLLELAKAARARFLFASSIDIYQGLASSSSLDFYFGEGRDARLFSHAEAKRFGESLVWEYYKKYDLDVRIARLGELYGPRMDLRSGGNLGRLIKELLEGRELTVEGDGLDKEYYCYIKDAVSALEKAVFKENTKGRIYPICDLQPITVLEQAYIIKKLSPAKTEVIFKPTLRKFKLPEIKVIDGHTQKELDWKVSHPLKEGVKKTLESFGFFQKEAKEEVPTVPQEEEKPAPPLSLPKIALPLPKLPSPKPLTKLAAVLAAVTIFLALNPLTVAGINGLLGLRALSRLEKELLSFRLEKAQNEAKAASSHFLKTKKALYNLPGLKTENLQNLASTAYLTSKGLESITQGLKPFAETLTILGFRTTENPPEEGSLKNLREDLLNLSQAEQYFSLAEGELKSLDVEKLPKALRNRAERVKRNIPKLVMASRALKIAGEALPEVLGFNGSKTYLLVFQNSNELRPTGGFIGSYARFDLDKGKLVNLRIDDIYNPDGLLDEKGITLPAPKTLKEHLGVENLRLRDANWSPDFPTAARTFGQLYQKATAEDAFGMVALDLVAVGKILSVTGPVYLSTFDETVTSENLFEKAEFRSEAGYFPGSRAKKTFLSALGESLLEKLFSLKNKDFKKLTAALGESLESKNILISLSEPRLSLLLSEKGWDGRVKSSSGDYLMVVEANVGSTKANYFVHRQLRYKIDKINREGEMEAQLFLNYVHTGESDAWPGGPYKCYLRVLVPQRSALLKVTRSTEDLEGRGEDITDKVKIDEELGKTTFETLFELKAGESLALAFSYVIPPEVLNFPEGSSYKLLFQKQPGTRNDPLTFEFTPPFGKAVTYSPLGSEKLGNIIHWKGTLSKDLELEIPLE